MHAHSVHVIPKCCQMFGHPQTGTRPASPPISFQHVPNSLSLCSDCVSSLSLVQSSTAGWQRISPFKRKSYLKFVFASLSLSLCRSALCAVLYSLTLLVFYPQVFLFFLSEQWQQKLREKNSFFL